MAHISPLTAAFLRQALRDSGQSISAIAKGACVPQPVVSRFYNGQQGLTLKTAAKLKQHLGLLPRRTYRDSGEEGLVNLISIASEELWLLEQQLAAVKEGDEKLKKALMSYRRRFLKPRLAFLQELLQQHYPSDEMAVAEAREGR
jgi:hypothetical protein